MPSVTASEAGRAQSLNLFARLPQEFGVGRNVVSKSDVFLSSTCKCSIERAAKEGDSPVRCVDLLDMNIVRPFAESGCLRMQP